MTNDLASSLERETRHQESTGFGLSARLSITFLRSAKTEAISTAFSLGFLELTAVGQTAAT